MFFECKTQGTFNDRDESNDDQSPYFANAWYENYLSRYSGLNPTRPGGDRLIALSGVIEEYLESMSTIGRAQHRKPLPDGEDTNAWWRCGLCKLDLISGLA